MTYWETIFSGQTLLSMGLAFISIGMLFYFFPRLCRRSVEYRKAYTDALEKEGEFERANTVRKGTIAIERRTPIYGIALALVGVSLITASFFTAQ